MCCCVTFSKQLFSDSFTCCVTCCSYACQFMCLLSLLLLVPFLLIRAWPWALAFFQMLLLETRLSISCQHVSVSGVNLGIGCCWCCRCRFFVVVTVDRVLTFVGEGHGVSQSDSSLLCQVRSYARLEDLRFFVIGALLVGINLFSLEGHAFHGVDSLVCFVVFLFRSGVCHSVAWVVVMLYESPRR